MIKPLRFYKTGTGCHVIVSHATNSDGYFRKYIHNYPGYKVQMFHRVVWEMRNGIIPHGCEIDHTCKNRACCNPDHLRLIEGKLHAEESNRSRYKDRIEFGKKLITLGIHTNEIADITGVTNSNVRVWKRSMGLEIKSGISIIPVLGEPDHYCQKWYRKT